MAPEYAPPIRLGNAHPNIVPYQTFADSDGHIIVACGNDRQFQAFCKTLGLSATSDDPRFSTNPKRVENRDVLTKSLSPAFNGWAMQDILTALEDAVVPAGPINTVVEALADPQIKHRAMQIAPSGVPGLRTPISFSRSRLDLGKASPSLPKSL